MRWVYIWLGNLDHAVSILIASGAVAGQSIGGSAPSADLGSPGIASGFGTFGKARALTTLSARLPLARGPVVADTKDAFRLEAHQ